jgi:exodeoxyribonuclease-1
MKDLQSQWKQWSAQEPAVFITYNGHAFDEELIRRQFFWNLLEPYTTNTNGNGRLDLMLMIHNIAAFFSNEIPMPLFNGGPEISYKLEHLAQQHGIDAGDAHDAIADCNLMIDLCKIIRSKLPEVFQSFINISTKQGIKNLLYSDDFLALGEIHRRHTFTYPVVMCGADASRPNEIVFFNLSHDPEDIMSLDYSEINKIIQTKGRDNPLMKYKINKTIPICSHKLLNNPDVFDIEFSELQRRADIVRLNKDFQSKVSQAMEDRMMDFPESEYIEGTIYSGGFPSYRDKDLMQEFHSSDDLEHLIKISRNFEDERLRLFAERIICNQYPSNIPEDIFKRYQELIDQRNCEEGPWGSIEKSLIQIDKLLDERDEEESQSILKATKLKIESMKRT